MLDSGRTALLGHCAFISDVTGGELYKDSRNTPTLLFSLELRLVTIQRWHIPGELEAHTLVFTSFSITGQPHEKLDRARNLAGIRRPENLLYRSKVCCKLWVCNSYLSCKVEFLSLSQMCGK
ncbi:hypothetical protein XENOCAPTIV_012745 [Xenoophorus captivus]|uniref:Uncharacterized protein n=1 Tax=Xenoophorus captivus TaxID=1517983 RepID=A0ABV0S0R9_9TELE